MKRRLLKGMFIGVGALFLSTVGIFASDALKGIDGGWGNIAGVGGNGVCVKGMVPMRNGDHTLCVDMYEASPSPKCPHSEPRSVVQSDENARAGECFAASVPSVAPWSYVSLPQAQRLCAGAGKRLPTSAEWYRIALGTEEKSCVINSSQTGKTGTEQCVSGVGAYDAVGNVWEWVDETVVNRTYGSRDLPETGYVSSVDADGVPVTAAPTPDTLMGNDYIWSGKEGVFGVLRGGFYGGGDDAGLYTMNASVPTSFATQGVGFRCVDDVL